MKLRAVYDFNSEQMTSEDRNELEQILMTRRLVDFSYSEALSFKSGDEMQIIHPSIVNYKLRWWKVRHLESGRNGFIPEVRVFVTSKVKGTLVAIRDFDPDDMTYSDRIELENIIKGRSHVEFMRATKQFEIGLDKEQFVAGQVERLDHELVRSKFEKFVYVEHGRETSTSKDGESMKLENKEGEKTVLDRRRRKSKEEETRNSTEEKLKSNEKEMSVEQKFPDVKDTKDLSSVEFDQIDLSGTYNSAVDEQTLAFKRGDKLETTYPENIGESVGWWMVRHLNNGKVGFILRSCVVIKNDQEPSLTTLNELPLELLDMILEYSLMRIIMNSSPQQRGEVIVKTLASVDICWLERLRKPRLKRRILPRLRNFYKKATRRSAIIGNNRNYLSDNIDPCDELNASLLSLNCIREDQLQLIQRQRTKQEKNVKLLYFLSHFNQTMASNFVRCLRRTKQNTVARILENGGVVVKVAVLQNSGSATMYTCMRRLHEAVQDLRCKTKPVLREAEELVSQLKKKGIELLNSQLSRRRTVVVVWIWCRSQAALQHIQRLYESKQLADVLFGFENLNPSTSRIMQSVDINIHSKQFKKTDVECPISFRLTERIYVGRYDWVRGVTKLRNEIYVLCGQYSYSPHTPFIFVYEDRKPFRLQRKINIAETINPEGIGSSERENCVFVLVLHFTCIWKMTRELDGQHKLTKWLSDDARLVTWSVSKDGQLLMYNPQSLSLVIYGSDAKPVRTIPLSRDIGSPRHAMETSTGNLVILHDSSWRESIGELKEDEEKCMQEKRTEDERGSSGKKSIERKTGEKEEAGEGGRKQEENGWCVSELTLDGKVVRRFIPSDETQTLNSPEFLCLDSDDQVFVADRNNHRVILLDSDLNWNRIICHTKEDRKVRGKEEEDRATFMPQTLYYDDETGQLIVGSYVGGLHVYTLRRI